MDNGHRTKDKRMNPWIHSVDLHDGKAIRNQITDATGINLESGYHNYGTPTEVLCKSLGPTSGRPSLEEITGSNDPINVTLYPENHPENHYDTSGAPTENGKPLDNCYDVPGTRTEANDDDSVVITGCNQLPTLEGSPDPSVVFTKTRPYVNDGSSNVPSTSLSELVDINLINNQSPYKASSRETKDMFDRIVTAIKNSQGFLTKEWKKTLVLLKPLKKNGDMLFQEAITPRHGAIVLHLTVEQVTCQLSNDNWFNGDIVTDWARQLNKQFNVASPHRSKVFDNFLFTKLVNAPEYCYDNIKKQMVEKHKDDITDPYLKHVIIPVNKSLLHWFLMVISPGNKEIWLIDSAHNNEPKKYFEYVMRFWYDSCSFLLGTTINTSQWKFIVKATTHQIDGTSCGAYICSNMYMVCTGNYSFRYPHQWHQYFKKFMLHCFRTPCIFELTDLCPVCGNWCNPHECNTVKCITCLSSLHIKCANINSKKPIEKGFQYKCSKYWRTSPWCSEIPSHRLIDK
jgi:Ulp1 protease family, C-terminal catalytic domain